MKKIVFLALLASFGGCSNFSINAPICDQIQQEPNTQNIPQECKKYDKKKADAAYDKKKEQQKADVEDIIEFQKEEN